MRKIATVTLCVSACLPTLILTGCASSLPREAWSPQEFVISSHASVVPLLRDSTGLYYVDVGLNGLGPYRLLLDTGAYGLFLAEDVVRDLNCPPLPRTQVMARNTSGQDIPAQQVVRLDEVRLGSHYLCNLHASVHTRAQLVLPSTTPYDGILGIGVFHDVLLILDIAQHCLQIVPGHLRENAPFVAQTINRKRDVPRISLALQTVGERAYECGAVVDTGANILELPQSASQWPIPRTHVRDTRLHEVGGQTRQSARYRIRARVLLGDSQCQITDPVVGFRGQTGRLSTDVLGQMILIFDQQYGRLAFLPHDQRAQLPGMIQSDSQNLSFN